MNTFMKLLVSGILSLGIIVGVQQNTTSTQSNNIETTNLSEKITSEEAKQIALEAVDGIFQKIVDDNDEYDIYIKNDQYIYEIDVDKNTGKITGVDKEEVKTQTTNTTISNTKSTTTQTTNTTKKTTLAQAKQIALKRVNGTVQKTIDDNDEYDIYIKKDSYIYKIEVNKTTGQITEVDKETVKTTSNTTTNKESTTKNITLAQAKQLALKKVNGKIITTKTDSDDYEITIQKGQYVYEIEVNKKTGEITDIDKEKAKSTNIISSAKAKQIALGQVNGTVESVEYDADDCEYSVEIMKDNIEYEVTIHAETGKVLEIEKD